MTTVATVAVAIVALLHVWFMVLEMHFWDKPLGRKVFRLKPEQAQMSKPLAMNQGLYNGFVAAGLFWGLYLGAAGRPVLLFFLGFVVVAGIVGGLTANRSILWVQALPGAVALALVQLAR